MCRKPKKKEKNKFALGGTVVPQPSPRCEKWKTKKNYRQLSKSDVARKWHLNVLTNNKSAVAENLTRSSVRSMANAAQSTRSSGIVLPSRTPPPLVVLTA